MGDTNHPQCDESFLNGPSKVVELIEFLEVMVNANKMEDPLKKKKKEAAPIVDISADVTDNNYFISQRSASNSKGTLIRRTKAKIKSAINTDQFTFMRQIDQKQEERAITWLERARVASNFRRLGNNEYRRDRFGNAINYYTKGLEYVKDTPVLYINRACCYMRVRNFKRAILDCDYILTKLDSKYVRAWLYRAAAYKRQNDEKNYEESVYQAKRLNSKDIAFINEFLEKMRTSF